MPESEPSDEQLMAAYVAGEQFAFQQLFGRWAPRIRRVYLRSGLRREDADDLVQQCFLQFHRARNDFRVGSRVHPWIYTIALNLRRQLFRRRGRKPEEGLDLDVGEPRAPAIDPDAPLVAATIRTALMRLPDPHREVIVLHWYEGLSFPEIAEILGGTATAMKVRAHRGYVKLRAELEAVGVTVDELRNYGGQVPP
ncbi:MAG: RNA polymerase sigma factor [Deltaproteobacteria bacterium]|nr:RNA polymerase sigma factor [Nannocystaceae bacterium]